MPFCLLQLSDGVCPVNGGTSTMEKEAKKLFSRAKDSLSKAKRTYTCRTLKYVAQVLG